MYFGNALGSFRIFPSNTEPKDSEGVCSDYDPRFRPWYVTGSSGGKNVILIIDVSGSMDGIRLSLAQQAAKAVITTLSNNDFVGVASFSNSATALHVDQLERATSNKKTTLIEHIDALEAYGDTNYEAAFRKGFDMINSMVDD